MISYQHIHQLKELYRLKQLGTQFCEPIELKQEVIEAPETNEVLPNDLNALSSLVHECRLCDLNKSRTQALPGFGNQNAEIMIIADKPTLAEDSEGVYRAKAGMMLRNMIEKVLECSINDVYYTHIVKCMPANFQEPTNSEILSCKPFLHKQIELINPKIIVTLGELSYNYLTNDHTNFGKVRGNLLPYHGYSLVPTHAPSKMITNTSLKRETMQDLQVIKSFLC